MAQEELHGVVDVEKIEPKSVRIVEERDKATPDSPKKYKVVYSLPIAVSHTWQAMFQKPDPIRSGAVHQLSFTFSDDGKEVEAALSSEPSSELLLVLKSYAKRANDLWAPYREKALKNRPEEEKILKTLKKTL